MTIKTGEEYRFDYLFADDENTLYAEDGITTLWELRERHGQMATIVRELRTDEYDSEGARMFEVEFADGYRADVWDFELVK